MTDRQPFEAERSEEPNPAPAKRRLNLWPFLPVLLLLFSVTVQSIMISNAMSTNDVVEENYYAKAVAWDERVAQERKNEQLGWRVKLSQAQIDGETRVDVMVTDSGGALLEGISVEMEAFANAHSAERITRTLEKNGGLHSAKLNVSHAGLWVINITVSRGEERFTHTERFDLVSSAR